MEALVWSSSDNQLHVVGGKPGVQRPPFNPSDRDKEIKIQSNFGL